MSSPSFFEDRFHSGETKRPNEVRTQYERDRARIIHSSAFRRLQGKTQVMGVGEGDFHRTRLTHTIECVQIGAGVLDQLVRSQRVPPALEAWRPPKELIEAACLAHDLGHPPFGHGGEIALFGKMRSTGGFEGNGHTLRILARLEKHSRPGIGINPTRRLVLAVLKYPKAYKKFDLSNELFRIKPPKCYFDDESAVVDWALSGFEPAEREYLSQCDAKQKPEHRTFDCSVMELADDIAYGVHDIEDIVARRLSTRGEVQDEMKAAFDAVGGCLDTSSGRLEADGVCHGLFSNSFQRKETIGGLVNTFMTAAIVEERAEFVHPLLRYRVSLPAAHRELLSKIRGMSHGLVISKPGVQQLERRGKKVVSELFDALLEDPAQLIQGYAEEHAFSAPTKEREVCDYVAGMTDTFAEKIYRRLFIPGFGSSHDEL